MTLQSQLAEYQPFLDAIQRGETVQRQIGNEWRDIKESLETVFNISVHGLRIKNPYQEYVDAIETDSEEVQHYNNEHQAWEKVWKTSNYHIHMQKNNPSLREKQFRFAPKPDPYQKFRDAIRAGKIIQYKRLNPNWRDIPSPYFDDDPSYYRIKPEPQKVEIAIKWSDNGFPIVRRAGTAEKMECYNWQFETITQKL